MTRGIRWTEILLREGSLLAVAFQTISSHREVSLLLFKEEIKGQVLQGIQAAEQGYPFNYIQSLRTSQIQWTCSAVVSWCFLTINTLELAAMGILGVDKNMDGWLKRSFNPASNELIWNKLPTTNYHLVLIDLSPTLMLLFHKQNMNCWV